MPATTPSADQASASRVRCVDLGARVTGIRRLRVAVDYGAFPVWDMDVGGMVDPGTLPIDAVMVAGLQQWADRFDAALDWDDPAASTTPSPAWRRRFHADGWALARALQAQLGPAYQVSFGDEPVT